MATTEAENEALWISQFLTFFGFQLLNQPVNLQADNEEAISLTESPEFHHKTKHIEVRWHWIREKVEKNEIVISYISTKALLADRLTKVFGPKIFKDFRRMIQMTWAGRFCPSGSTREESRTSWKVIDNHGNSGNLMEGLVSMTKYDMEVSRNF